MKLHRYIIYPLILLSLVLSGCGQSPAQPAGLRVLAVESFLADIAQNVAGDRAQVEMLIPLGLDPHAFEPTPQDVARVAQSTVLIVNGAGLEEWLDEVLVNAGGERIVIEAAAGLQMRTPREGELAGHHHEGEEHNENEEHHHHHEGDPHFWLDPLLIVAYVENIRAGLTQADPAGAEIYAANAAAYITQLKELDAWIQAQVATIPAERRLLVTNHESFGYYADRYGFRVVGAVIPSVSTGATPTAQEMAALVESIRSSGAPAIFLETGANPQLAEQISRETGVAVVSDLYTHSITAADGEAPTYLAMMRRNTEKIVAALK